MMFGKIFLLICFISIPLILDAATVNNIDGPYDPIQIQIPNSIWQQAFKPTSVLKSAATIVIPIHVNGQNDYDDEVDDNEIVNEDEIVNNEVVEEALITSSTHIPILADATIASAESTSNTPAPEDPLLLEDEGILANDTAVTGQVVRFPCSCVEGQCGCCTGTVLQTMNMKACGNISFVPEDFVFDVRLSVNNQTMVRRRVSASDPPPICFNPRRAPFVRVCAEITNIRIRNNNAYACMDINADIGGFDVYSASFRCFGLGLSGVQTGLKPKPVSSGPTPVSLFGNGDRDEEESDDGPGLLGGFADGILGGGQSDGGIFSEGGLFGGGGGSDSDDDDGGPFDDIGDAFDGFGDFLDARR